MNPYFNYSGNLFIGDVVSVQKGAFRHVGIVVTEGILENRPGSFERVVSLPEFTGNLPYQVRRTDADPRIVMARARKILAAPRPYNPVSQNCEHTVSEVLMGRAESPQLAGMLFFGSLAALFVVAAQAG